MVNTQKLNPLLEGAKFSKPTADMLNKEAYVEQSDRMHVGLNAAGTKFVVRLSSAEDTAQRLKAFASWYAKDWAEATPGFHKIQKEQRIRGDYFTFHASDFFVFRTLNSWDLGTQVTFEDTHTELLFYTIYSRFVAGEISAKRLLDWKESGILPASCGGVERADMPLNGYQRLAVLNSGEAVGFALFMEQGTGKTPCVVVRVASDAVAKMAELAASKSETSNEYYRAIVVAPLNVKFNWEGELNKFSAAPIKCVAIDGTLEERIAQLRLVFTQTGNNIGGVAVMSYQTAAAIVPLLQILEVKLDLVALDESHNIKNHTAKTSKAMLQLRDLAEKRMVLTGTPIGNSILDLWTQLEFLYVGCSGFTTFAAFAKFYQKKQAPDATSQQKLEAMLNMPLLKERLARCSFIISKKEALPNLPEKVYSVRECSISGMQKEIYRKLALEMAVKIEEDLDRAEKDSRQRSVFIKNALNKALKIAQVTSGFVKWDDVVNPISGDIIQPSFIEYTKENPKLDLLIEELKELDKDTKAIVWCHQIPALHLIFAACKRNGFNPRLFYGETDRESREAATAAFNDTRLLTNPNLDVVNDPNTCRVICANPAAASAGLNWLGYPPGRPELSPMDASAVFYFARDFSHLKHAQSSDRSHRVGTRKPVSIRSLLCDRTVDVHIHKVLEAKAEVALDVQDVREILVSMLTGI